MNNLEFGLHFAENAFEGIAFMALALLVNLLVLRRYVYSLFDPLLFYTTLSAAAGGVVLYLAYYDLIRSFYLVSYLATQGAFLAGFVLLKPPPKALRPRALSSKAPYGGAIRVLYPLSVALFVASQGVVYAVTGIPLFLESRLEAFAGGTGYGFLSRVIFVTSNISLTIAFYRLLFLRRKAWSRRLDVVVILFCISVAVLSGSKGALLALIFTASLAAFFAQRFYPAEEIDRRARKVFFLMLLLSFPVGIGVIIVQAGMEEVVEVIAALMMRFVQTGDIFFMVYPNDILAQLPDSNGLLALFYSPLGGLRLLDREHLPVNLGLQAFWYHYNTDLLSGPNARHNVFGLHYFGVLASVLFSFILGLVFSLARNGAYRSLPATPMGMVVYVMVVTCALFIEQDVAGQAIEYLFSVLLVFPVLHGLASLLHVPPHRGAPVFPHGGGALAC